MGMDNPDQKCECGHTRSQHMETLTCCKATWANPPPPDTSLSPGEIDAMPDAERRQRFGHDYCKCNTFRPAA